MEPHYIVCLSFPYICVRVCLLNLVSLLFIYDVSDTLLLILVSTIIFFYRGGTWRAFLYSQFIFWSLSSALDSTLSAVS